jgi:hypothetical protein
VEPVEKAVDDPSGYDFEVPERRQRGRVVQVGAGSVGLHEQIKIGRGRGGGQARR